MKAQDLIKMMCLHVSTDKTRPALQNIYVDVDNGELEKLNNLRQANPSPYVAFLVATNGHTLIRHPITDNDWGALCGWVLNEYGLCDVLPIAPVKGCIVPPKGKRAPTFTTDPEFPYPDYEECLPKKTKIFCEELPRFGLSFTASARIARTYKFLGIKTDAFIPDYYGDFFDPVKGFLIGALVKITEGTHTLILAMPVRIA